jgi:NAD(P)-dependent dehydrogenase (short-subunit alcohol dehydrogenase family)
MYMYLGIIFILIWRRSFEVNVKSIINVSQVVAQSMKDSKKGGSIVNLSSQVPS